MDACTWLLTIWLITRTGQSVLDTQMVHVESVAMDDHDTSNQICN
jgi:hypothetical protein